VIITHKDLENECKNDALLLVPQIITVGIGCRKDIIFEAIEKSILNIFENENYHILSINALASIDKKANEKGILEFAKKYGELGPVYGKQWRDSYGVDQLLEIEKSIKENPFSRRHIICAWNPSKIDEMALPPCHAFVQFYVSGDGKKLSCQLYQRSADLFLGVPFNIASYATLLIMMAHVCNLEPGEFIHTFGDVHIYSNLVDQVKTQIEREPRELPRLIIKRKVESILDFKYEDFEVVGYNPHPKIEGKVSV
jgi:thymidylate synthase